MITELFQCNNCNVEQKGGVNWLMISQPRRAASDNNVIHLSNDLHFCSEECLQKFFDRLSTARKTIRTEFTTLSCSETARHALQWMADHGIHY